MRVVQYSTLVQVVKSCCVCGLTCTTGKVESCSSVANQKTEKTLFSINSLENLETEKLELVNSIP